MSIKQEILNFIAERDSENSSASILFSFSQMISGEEYFSLSKKLLQCDFLFYWSDTSEHNSFIACGEVYSIKCNSIDDISSFDNQLRNLPFNIVKNNESLRELSEPLFVGGIKFPSQTAQEVWNEFAFAKWCIPQILLVRNGPDFKMIINTFRDNFDYTLSRLEHLEKESGECDDDKIKILSSVRNMEFDQWSGIVDSALAAISHTKLKKVVLSRFEKVELSNSPCILHQLQKLEKMYSNCVTFAYKSKGSIFFGATPEKLYSIKDGFLEADALAGSIQRGDNEDDDKRFRELLLCDVKNLAEHKSVVDFILRQLTSITEKILFDTEPSIKSFPNIQHLYSQIRAKLKMGESPFSVLAKLYPTPAVCGFPSKEALSTIHEIESFDRGLFAGAVGWFNLNGKAEFSVGIRSALLRDNQLYAYAGCGIVEGSDSLSEYNETELKLKPIQSLFANETVNKS